MSHKYAYNVCGNQLVITSLVEVDYKYRIFPSIHMKFWSRAITQKVISITCFEKAFENNFYGVSIKFRCSTTDGTLQEKSWWSSFAGKTRTTPSIDVRKRRSSFQISVLAVMAVCHCGSFSIHFIGLFTFWKNWKYSIVILEYTLLKLLGHLVLWCSRYGNIFYRYYVTLLPSRCMRDKYYKSSSKCLFSRNETD